MKQSVALLASATLGAALFVNGSAWSQVVYGYYGYYPPAVVSTLDGEPITGPIAVAGASAAPLYTGRSVATGPIQMGNYCSTPVKTCALYHASWVGSGCSCRIPGGRSQGTVTP